MKRAEKTKEQLVKEIDSLQRQIKELGKLRGEIENKESAIKEFDRTLEDRVECRTSAERIVHKQLCHEIELRKKAELAVQDAFEYADNIINTVRESLIILDVDLRVVSANRFFYTTFGVKPHETQKQHIYELGNRQWDIPKLRELLEHILPESASFDNFEVVHDFPGIGKRIMLLNAREVYQKLKRTKLILLAIEDITARKELEEKLKTLASHDELTGCINFRSTMEFLENEIARSRRYQKQFSIIMLDIDHFKRINDEHGHLAGNDALTAFARVLKNNVRSIDMVGRYGGDEFVIVLPESDARQASAVLQRIRHDLEQTKIALPYLKEEAEGVLLKFSAGVAVFPRNANDLKELIWVVDRALRQAKQEGPAESK